MNEEVNEHEIGSQASGFRHQACGLHFRPQASVHDPET